MTDAIDVYLDTLLTPQLEHMGVQSFPGAREAVVTDIRLRLQSVLSRWQDVPTRNPLLFLGREEGAFYEPRSASLEVRAFVVVTVRNSLLEDLGIPVSQHQRSPCKRHMFGRSWRLPSGIGKPSMRDACK